MADEQRNDESTKSAMMPEGIYLETKKNTIGTGSTAKVAEYRNFWATLRVSETVIEMVLLDDSFGLTGIKEKFSPEVVSGPNWLYVAQGEKKYQQLKLKLQQMLTPPSAKSAAKPATKPAAKPKGSGSSPPKSGWWSK